MLYRRRDCRAERDSSCDVLADVREEQVKIDAVHSVAVWRAQLREELLEHRVGEPILRAVRRRKLQLLPAEHHELVPIHTAPYFGHQCGCYSCPQLPLIGDSLARARPRDVSIHPTLEHRVELHRLVPYAQRRTPKQPRCSNGVHGRACVAICGSRAVLALRGATCHDYITVLPMGPTNGNRCRPLRPIEPLSRALWCDCRVAGAARRSDCRDA